MSFVKEVLKEQKRIHSKVSKKFSFLFNIQLIDKLMSISLLVISISLAIELYKHSDNYLGNPIIYLFLIFSIKLSMILRQLQKNE